MTLLLSLPLLVLGLLVQGPARSASAEAARSVRTQAGLQRLRVIIEDAQGKRVPGARIFFVGSELASLGAQEAPRQLEFRGDERGRAILSLDPHHDWAAWAVKEVGKQRQASPIQMRVLEKGILRLRLQPFPVPFVRISHLEPWRKLFKGKLSLVYIAESPPYPRFPMPLPEGKDEVRALPPLPMGNYFPVLWHAERGFLDTVYLSPAFHDGQADAEVLYERDYPLKKCIFGSPLLLRGKVQLKVNADMGLAGAHLRCGPSNRIPCILRQRVTTDAEGRYELVIPFKPASRRTSYFSDVVLWAPGVLPVQYSLESTSKGYAERIKKDGATASAIFERDLVATPGHELHWQALGAQSGDEFILMTQVLQGGNPGALLGIGLPMGEESRLVLPGDPFVGALGALFRGKKKTPRSQVRFELYARRSGRLLALAGRHDGTLPPKLTLDLSEMGTLELEGASVSGRRLKRGACEVKRIWSKGLATVGTRFGLSPEGSTTLDLPVGKYVLRLSQKPLGVGYASFEIQKGKRTPVRVSVERYLRIRGKVLCEDEEVKISGLPIQVYPQQLQQDRVPILARAWAQQSLQQISTSSRADGSFELLVSPFIQRLSLQTYASVANRYLSAQVQLDPHDAKDVELPLR